jgi:hypothetical protein
MKRAKTDAKLLLAIFVVLTKRVVLLGIAVVQLRAILWGLII